MNVKFTIQGDVSDLTTKLNTLKSQYHDTLKSISEQNDLLVKKQRELTQERNKQVSLTPKTEEMKASQEKVSLLNREIRAIKALRTELQANESRLKTHIALNQKELSQKKQKLALLEQEKNAQKSATQQLIKNIEAEKDRLLINSRAVQVERKYAQMMKDVISLRKQGVISEREELLAIKNLNNAKREELINNKSISNQIVRDIRQIESYVVALYGVKRAYDATLGVGFDYNKTIESELMGLKLLIVQNLKKVDSQGKLITLQERYNIAQKESIKMMEQIKKINPETPYNLKDTVKVYKALFPQLAKYKASMTDIADITKKFTIIAKANGLEVDQFIRTVDTAFSGSMANSQLKQRLELLGLTNKAIKEAIKNGTLLDLIKDKFKDVDVELLGLKQTWANASSAFETNWQTIWGELQRPLFEKLIKETQSLNDYMSKNSDDIIENIKRVGEAFKIVGGIGIAYMLNKSVKAKALFTGLLTIVEKGLFGFANMWEMVEKKGVSSLFSMGSATTTLSGKIARLGKGIEKIPKLFMSLLEANPIGILVMGFEAYNMWVNKSREATERLNKELHATTMEMLKATKAQRAVAIIDLQKEATEHRKIADELNLQYRIAKRKYGVTSDEVQVLKAKQDTEYQLARSAEKQLNLWRDIDTTTVDTVYNTDTLTDSVSKTADEATRLKNNMVATLMALHQAQRQMAVAQGSMSLGQKTLGDAKEKANASTLAFLSYKSKHQNDTTDIEYMKLQTKMLQDQANYIKVANGLAKQRLALSTQIADKNQKIYTSTLKEKDAIKSNIDYLKGKIELQKDEVNKYQPDTVEYAREYAKLQDLQIQKQSLITSLQKKSATHTKSASSSIKKQQTDAYNLYKEYLRLTNQTEKLKDIQNKETLNKFIKAGYDKKQIDELRKALNKVNKEVTLDFATQFKNMFDSLLKGDIAGAIKGLFSGISMEMMKNPIDKFSKYLGDKVSSIFSGLGDFGNLFGGLALGGIGSLLGNVLGGWLNKEETPPELESIHKTSQSMEKALDFIKNAQDPLLSYTKKQTEYLKIIASSFGNVGKNLLASGIDFSGDFYQETTKGGIFSTKSYELYGTDVAFNAASMADVISGNLQAYYDEVIKKTYSSLFKKKTSYFTDTTDISNLIAQDIANATKAMFSSIVSSSNLLGLSVNLNDILSETIDIGKIDTTGKTGTEIAKLIEERFGAEFDAIVNKYFGDALYEFQKDGEGLAETLSRVSVTFEQTADLLGQVGQQVNWQNANYLVDAIGGMEDFNGLWGSYIDNYYTDAEKWAMKQKTLAESFEALGMKMPETKANFRDLLETFDISDKASSETYAQLLKLSPLLGEYFDWMDENAKDALANQEDANKALEEEKRRQEELQRKQLDSLKSQLSFYDNLLKKIDGLYKGSLSYLNVFEKQAYFDNRAKFSKSQNDTENYLASLESRLEYDKQIATEKEDYAYKFDSYITELKQQKPKKTLDDVVLQIEDLKKEISETREAIKHSGKETVEATTNVANAVEASLYAT